MGDITTVRRIAHAVTDSGLAVQTAFLEPAGPLADFGPPAVGKPVVVSVDGDQARLREGGRFGGRRIWPCRRGSMSCGRASQALTMHSVEDKGKVNLTCRPNSDTNRQDADRLLGLVVGHLGRVGVEGADRMAIVGDGTAWTANGLDLLAKASSVALRRFAGNPDRDRPVEHLYNMADLRPGWGRDGA